MDKISVIIPCYNSAATLSRCLESILAQTYENFEVIIVADKSDDNSLKILTEYALRDDRITVVYKSKNSGSGVSRARNVGLKLATGDYIQFMDADDDIVPDMFARLIETAKETKADIVTFRFEHDCWKAFLPGGTYYLHNPRDGFKLYSDFFTFELPWNKFIRRGVVAYGYDESVGIYEGSLFYLKNHKGIKKIVVLEDKFYNYYNAGPADQASIVNGFLNSKFWENKTGYWHKFYMLEDKFKKALKKVYQYSSIEKFIQVRNFDIAFIEMLKLVDAKVPADIVALEMYNIFNEPAFRQGAQFFGRNMKEVDLELCNRFVQECYAAYARIKTAQLDAEPFYKYIELFFAIVCVNEDETHELPAFDFLLDNLCGVNV